MEHLEELVKLSAKGLKYFVKVVVDILSTFISTMSEKPGTSEESKMDPRLLSSGSGHSIDLQEMVKQAQQIRNTMKSSSKCLTSKEGSASKHHVSTELLTKVDSILAIVQNLQTNQREIYNYVRSIAPKYSVIRTDGPTEHFEIVNQTNQDVENEYLEKLRKSTKKH